MTLKIIEVKSAGDQKAEAVWVRVEKDCRLSEYMVADTTYTEEGVSNLNRHTFWFPNSTRRPTIESFSTRAKAHMGPVKQRAAIHFTGSSGTSMPRFGTTPATVRCW